MEYTEQDIISMINGVLKFNKIDTNISSKRKLQVLKNFKMLLETDNDYSYLNISHTNDEEKIDEYNSRMTANNQALNEIEHCIKYLNEQRKQEKQIKREKRLQFIKKYVKI